MQARHAANRHQRFRHPFRHVNGSGSASANEMFARAIMRMGIPMSPRNVSPRIFRACRPVRNPVTEAGHLGARGGTT